MFWNQAFSQTHYCSALPIPLFLLRYLSDDAIIKYLLMKHKQFIDNTEQKFIAGTHIFSQPVSR